MRRLGWTFAMLATAVALAACGSNASTSPTGTEAVTPMSPLKTPSVAIDPLAGTWRMSFTCDDVTKALDRAGLQKFENSVLRGWDCDGVMHQTLTFGDGAITIAGTDGSTSPPSPYHVVNDHTYVQGFLRNTYRVQGNRLIFVDTQIIKALYPYETNQIPGEHALDVGILQSAPFERVG
jgi:hypothetical protein